MPRPLKRREYTSSKHTLMTQNPRNLVETPSVPHASQQLTRNSHAILEDATRPLHSYSSQLLFTNTRSVTTNTPIFFFFFYIVFIRVRESLYRLSLMIGRGLAQSSSYWLLVISCHLVERGGGHGRFEGKGEYPSTSQADCWSSRRPTNVEASRCVL
jgi:hypothetical protein